MTTEVLRDGGRHASIADGSVTAAGGRYVWVRPDGPGLAALADLADAFRLNMAGHIGGKIAIRVSA